MFFLASFDLFAVNPGLIFWTVVTFSTVLFILWKFAWSPMIQGLDNRNDKIENDLKKSEELREEAEALLNEYKNKINKAEEEASQMMDMKKKNADAEYQKIVSKAQEDAKDILEKSKQQIQFAKEKAVQELEQGVVNITSKIVKKILDEDVDVTKHSNLIHNELKTLH